MSVVYRDREQSRFDDSKSAVSARSGATKVTRYIVKEDDSRTDYRASRAEPTRQSRYDDRSNYVASRFDDSRTNYDRDDTRFDETRTIRISRNEEEPQREYSRTYHTEPSRYTRETITIRRDEDDRRDEYWRRPSGEDVEDRELVIRRDTERDVARDGRTSVALSRVDDRRDTQVVSRVDDRRDTEIKVDDRRYSDYEVVNPRHSMDDREISRYIRTSEHYYPQQNQPQTIIIRQEPIIIRERERERERSRSRPREEEFQIVKKSEVDEERSVSRRSERPEPRDEEYFYEKRVRERLPEEDRRSRLRREVSPGDSISQVGRGRHSRRGSESDDSMVYVRKEKVTDYGSRDSSAHRGRDMAAGALAGVGAAELIRNHHQKEGKETSSGVGRLAKDAGAGILGAVAAEGIRRYRSKSRRRSRSSSSGRRSHRRRSRSRSRSSSNGRFGNIGGLGLAAAAVGVGALIASRNKKEAPEERRSRSRSRRRSSSRGRSVDSRLSELENDPNANDARNPKHRNSRTAAAGAIGAAAAALLERHRSKSRGRAHSESPNRFKQGVPIVATGLGTAALAHLYEKNKAKREAEEIIHDEDRRSRSRSGRSRSRGREGSSVYQDAPRQVAYSDPNLVQYGNEPLHGNNYGEGYYGNARAPEPDYYNNSNRAIVPAPVPPPATSSFDATARRPRSSSRTRSVSSSRSRSRSRGAAAAAAAVGAGVAASAYDQNRKEKKERDRRRRKSSTQGRGSILTELGSSHGSSRRQTFDSRASVDPYNGRDPYEDANWHATHSASYAQGMNDPYGSQAGFYPPPPGPMPQQGYAPQSYTPQPAYAPTPQPQGSYGPQDFPPPPPGAPQAQQQQFNPYAPNQNPYAPRSRGADDNVSAGYPSSAPTDQHRSASDGM